MFRCSVVFSFPRCCCSSVFLEFSELYSPCKVGEVVAIVYISHILILNGRRGSVGVWGLKPICVERKRRVNLGSVVMERGDIGSRGMGEHVCMCVCVCACILYVYICVLNVYVCILTYYVCVLRDRTGRGLFLSLCVCVCVCGMCV